MMVMFIQGLIKGAVATSRILTGIGIIAVGLWVGASVLTDCGNIDCTESMSTFNAVFGVIFAFAAISLGGAVVIWPTLRRTLSASREAHVPLRRPTRR